MNYKMIAKLSALVLATETVFMLPAIIIGLVYKEYGGVYSLLITCAITAGVSLVLHLFSRKAQNIFFARDGLVAVGLGWLALSAFGALPLYFSGALPSYIDALFETVSGFTTTGASVIASPEELPWCILYWRSFSHWIGGMGVLVFLLAIVPVSSGHQGFTMHILRAESPGPDVGKLVPKMRTTAVVLYSTYVILTVLDVIFLLFGGMSIIEALCTAFGTVGTGGFGIRADSLASYSSYIQIVTTVFMFLCGINFACYYLLLLKNVRSVLFDEELRLYVFTVILATGAITVNIVRNLGFGIGEAIKHSAFQVISIITTTGFSTVDFNLWPTFSKAIIMLLMCLGACAGSTGGGMKLIRALLLFKIFRRNVSQTVNPHTVKTVRVNGKSVDEKVLSNTNAYLAAYVIIIVVSFLIVSLDSAASTVTTGLTAVISCFNNIGPGLDAVGPMSNYANFNILSKAVLIIDMLLGRLEIFPILVLLNPRSWAKK